MSIDDCPVECLRINSVRTLLNGPGGSTFKMSVRRGKALFSLELTRKHEEDGSNSSPVVSGSVAAPSAVPATSGKPFASPVPPFDLLLLLPAPVCVHLTTLECIQSNRPRRQPEPGAVVDRGRYGRRG